jgi:23S rRNA (cytosine1962-C5)-methyltransferase
MSDRIVFADKPSGVTTHSSLNENERRAALADTRDGFVEHMDDRLGRRLFVNHRLDRETSGAICFSTDESTAAKLQELFSSREVHKTYLFLTDRTIGRDSLEVESFIERRGSEFVSITGTSAKSGTPAPNALTRLRRLARDHGVELWQAMPATGKPHQIRLHAEQAGLAILGDSAHGGSEFPALCLHSAEIAFTLDGIELRYSAPPPAWYTDRSLTKDRELVKWLAAIDRRERLARSGALPAASDTATLRWIHSEGDPLRAEQLGPVTHFSWYGDVEPTDRDLARIRRLAELKGWQRWYLQTRGNRGRTPNSETKIPGPLEIPERWSGEENGLRFEYRSESGLSPGLFLDQRRNRAWVKANAQGKSVLNLFCYTGGFSVAAASGGASKTVSVDVSKPFLEWAKTNFVLNDLATEQHEYRAMDSREYLAWAKKKGLRFDLVICDPPSFGRSPKLGVFSIAKDFAPLMESLLDVTAEGGRILFSSNFENWTIDDFERRTRALLQEKRWRAKLLATPSPDWDFELPKQKRNMKSFFVVRI